MKNYIGTVLKFNKIYFEANVKKYNAVIDAVNKVKMLYEALDPSFKFTAEAWQNLLANNLVDVSEKYNGIVASQLKAAKFTAKALVNAMELEAGNNLTELKEALANVFQIVEKELSGNQMIIYTIDPSLITVEDSKVVLGAASLAALRKIYEYKIEMPEQNTFYNLLLAVKQDYKALRDFTLLNTNFQNQDNLIGSSTNEMFYEARNGALVINEEALDFLKK